MCDKRWFSAQKKNCNLFLIAITVLIFRNKVVSLPSYDDLHSLLVNVSKRQTFFYIFRNFFIVAVVQFDKFVSSIFISYVSGQLELRPQCALVMAHMSKLSKTFALLDSKDQQLINNMVQTVGVIRLGFI